MSRKVRRVLVATATLALAQLMVGCKGDQGSRTPQAPQQTVSIRLLHSPEAAPALQLLRERFLAAHRTLVDGTLINLELITEGGVSGAKRLASGAIQPQLWLAAGEALPVIARSLGASAIAPEQCTTVFSSPAVYATTEQTAQRLAKGGATLSSPASLSIAEDRYPVVLSHGMPDQSATGLLALQQLMELARVAAPAASESALRQTVAQYEERAVQYHESEQVLLRQLLTRANAQVHRLVITSEQQLVQFNQGSATKLIPLYPEEGSHWQQYQLCRTNASWVTPAQQAAARVFAEFMDEELAQQTAAQFGFRPQRIKALPTELITQNRIVATQPARTLASVSGVESAALLNSWPELQRPSATLLVIDGSASMVGAALQGTKSGLRVFLAATAPRNRKAMLSFASEINVEVPFTNDAPSLLGALDSLRAVGGSAALDATQVALDRIRSAEISGMRKELIIISDGEGSQSVTTPEQLAALAQEAAKDPALASIVIGIRNGSNSLAGLEAIARSLGGEYHEVSPYEVEPLLLATFAGR